MSTKRTVAVAALNLAAAVGLYLGEVYVGERTWPTTLLTYLPQPLFAALTLGLLAAAILRRTGRGPLMIHLAAAAFCFAVLMPLKVAGLAALTCEQGKTDLRVATFNIEGGHAGAAGLVPAIHALNADLLCLQEAHPLASDPAFRESLKADYPYWATEGAVAIASHYPLESVQVHTLSPGPSCLSARVRSRIGTVTVVSVHLLPYRYEPFGRAMDTPQIAHESWGDWRFSTRRREPQIPALCDALNRLPGPLIVCGDFNTPPRGRLYESLKRGANLRDVWCEAGVGYGFTLPARLPSAQVDHLFQRGDTLTARRAFVPATADASDHRPVVADFLRTPVGNR